MKRPFSILEENKRTIIENKICKYFIERSTFERDYISDGEYPYKKFSFLCPCCDKKLFFSVGLTNWGYRGFIPSFKDGKITNEGIYWFAYSGVIRGHLEKQICMYGNKKAMQIIMDIFGEHGQEILQLLVKRNILATRNILEFLNEVEKKEVKDG